MRLRPINLKQTTMKSSPPLKGSEKSWWISKVKLKGEKMFYMELNGEYYDIVRTKTEAMQIMAKLR